MSNVSGRDILLGVLTFSMICVVIKIIFGSSSVEAKEVSEDPEENGAPSSGASGFNSSIVTGPAPNSLKINGGLYYTLPAYAYLYSKTIPFNVKSNIIWQSFATSNITVSENKIILGPIGIYEITCSGAVKNYGTGGNTSPMITMTGNSFLTNPNVWFLSAGPPISNVSGYAFNVNFNTMTKTTVVNTPISFSTTNVEFWPGMPLYLTIKYVSL